MAIYKNARFINLPFVMVISEMRRLYTKSDYDEVVCDADMFITGSDQIWNPFCGGFNPMMFLEFVNDGTKRIAYSSSIFTGGNSSICEGYV